MGGKVGVGDTTQADVATLQEKISHTQTVLKTLTDNGNNLANPQVWDGDYASTFRSGWNDVSDSFNTLVTALNKLHGEVEQITAAIRRAGGSQ